jgi:predicted nucleic acid-binding protein
VGLSGATALRKIVLDTNVYIGWLNDGLNEAVVIGPGRTRYLSAVVQMELRAGASKLPTRRAADKLLRAYQASGRYVAPDGALFDAAGTTLRALKGRGREIRRASLVADVLIAHTARSLGATLVTRDRDFEAIRDVFDFELDLIDP